MEISTAVDWSLNDPGSLYFNDLTITSTGTLTVPSGLVIRVAGNFHSDGVITVKPSGGGGKATIIQEPLSSGGTVWVTYNVLQPQAGIAATAAANGIFSRAPPGVGGLGGIGDLTFLNQKTVTRPGQRGGGGGGASHLAAGGQGGGTIVLAVRGTLVLNGTLSATGASAEGACAGGGGGGVVVLASGTSISGNGTILVNGGNGGNGVANICAGGGGGGGGLINFLAPNWSHSGLVGYLAGSGGSPGGSGVAPVGTGGGGGASSGSGGAGGGFVGGTTLAAGEDGREGLSVLTFINPAPML